ncbi:MAG: carboxypeptidase regulatory-like domain-containing protein [Anaeromyxobacteraceae bacterium]
MAKVSALAALVVATGCGGGDEKVVCNPAAQTGCGGGQVCEAVPGATAACFDPVILAGTVTDLATARGLAGARLVALDANRAPASAVATSAEDGTYRVALPWPRAADGTPLPGSVTLRADRAGYQGFPGGLRQALPVDLSSPARLQGSWSVRSALTDVGLVALPAGAGTGAIHGKLTPPADGAGVLVVAETSSGGALHGASAVADRGGDFAILNLAAGEYTVRAYAKGASYGPATVALAAGQDAPVQLGAPAAATGTVSGSVQIVNGGQGTTTSVVLVVESTFEAALARGDVPPGLRASGVTGSFSVAGVPEGRYVALAAFEDDRLVRDPDTSIGGTQIAHVTVSNGATVPVAAFKVTGALDVIAPGATGPEAITSPTPLLSWADDSSEDHYRVTVLDAFGSTLWELTIPGVSGGTPSVRYGQAGGTPATAPALAPGMYYQFRVASLKSGVPISTTEDLKGVFQYAP